MKRLFVFFVCAAFLFSSCHFMHDRIRGNGNVVTQSRSFSNFNGVDVSSAIHVYIKQDSAFSVKVETDENLQSYIDIWEENGVLRIKQENNTSLDATGQIRVYVTAPSFNRVEASGACKVKSENDLNTPEAINIHVSGASDIELDVKTPGVIAGLSGASSITVRGATKDLDIEGSGASHARCFELLSENAVVDISGASSADLFASVKLDAEASGASDIKYKGSASVTSKTSGASHIRKVD